MGCGIHKPSAKIELRDKTTIIQTISLHKGLLASLAELSDFKKGLNALGVAEALTEHCELLRPFFCNDTKVTLTSSQFTYKCEQAKKFNIPLNFFLQKKFEKCLRLSGTLKRGQTSALKRKKYFYFL